MKPDPRLQNLVSKGGPKTSPLVTVGLFLRRAWHIVAGHGKSFEMGVFYSRRQRCRRAWATTSSGALSGLAGEAARIVLDELK